ncbi:MAG: response regulator [Spirochaetota bacterium]
MKRKLLYNVLAALSVTILIISGAIGFNSTVIVKSLAERTINNTLSLTINHIKLMDNFLILIEDSLQRQARAEIRELSGKIAVSLEEGDLNDQMLSNLAETTQADEIYIIDDDYTITHTTFPPDKGLRMSYNSEFTSFLDTVYERGIVFSHRPTTSNQTGTLNVYYYYSPPGSDHIVETSYSIKSYIISRYTREFYYSTFKLFELDGKRSSIISNIDIVSFNNKTAWSFLHEGVQRTDLDMELLRSIPEDKSWTDRVNGEYVLYKNIGSITDNPLFYDSLFIVLRYRLDIMRTVILQIAAIASAVAVFTFIISIYLFTRFLNKNIIDRIMTISSEIKNLHVHGFRQKISIRGEDELNDIAHNINAMSERIVERETQLSTLKNYLNDIIDTLQTMIIVIDHENRITLINRTACALLRTNTKPATGADIYTIFPELKKYADKIDDVRTSGRSCNNKDRALFPYFAVSNISIMPMVHESFENVIIKIDDISDIEKKDEQLLQAQKMEVIGTLAGGFAHNLNNVLSGVVGSVSLLKHRLKTYSGPDRNFFDETVSIISSSAEKAVDMAKELLSISKKRQTEFGPVFLDHALENVIKMCNHIFDTDVKISYTKAVENPKIFGNLSQIEHLFLNIFVNAYHAMTIMHENPDNRGGTLTVILSKAIDTSFLRETFDDTGRDYWEVSIADTGVGIPEEIRDRIFDPFLSTKPTRGTGLGLATVYSIVQQHGGAIQVRSNRESGTVFSLTFPAFSDGTLAVQKETDREDRKKLKEGSGHILIIDDEPFVRQTAKTILESAGYTVSIAESGDEGLALFTRQRTVDLVLLDMIMPGKSGKETFIELTKIDPDVKIILSSGFINDSSLEELQRLGLTGYIRKPYSAIDLAEVVHNAIYG